MLVYYPGWRKTRQSQKPIPVRDHSPVRTPTHSSSSDEPRSSPIEALLGEDIEPNAVEVEQFAAPAPAPAVSPVSALKAQFAKSIECAADMQRKLEANERASTDWNKRAAWRRSQLKAAGLVRDLAFLEKMYCD